MAVSGNGWPVSPDGDGLVPFTVGGVNFGLVRGGKVYELLHYVATQVHNRVQKANKTYGCWGWAYRMNVNSPGSWSNHASGTAIDYNATLHPNGSATVNNWSAAQIAEIHAILGEVGGKVRWGGDYNSTPDAMHFEINVPPSALGEDVVVPTAGTVLSTGQPNLNDYRNMPVLKPMSVSYPTMARYSAPDRLPGTAYWLFHAEKTGAISFDALLSHYQDPEVDATAPRGPVVRLTVFTASHNRVTDEYEEGTSIGDSTAFVGTDFGLPDRDQGRLLVNVTAGQTYIIRTMASPSFPWIRTVVRVGDYASYGEGASEGGWIQPPDQVHVYGRSDGNILPSSTGANPDLMGVEMTSFSSPHSMAQTFGGWKILGWAFGGVHPGLDAGAIQCAWAHARRMDDPSLFNWSIDGLSTWNGTGMDGEPYDWGVGGSGFCRAPDAEIIERMSQTSHNELGQVGYHYSADLGIALWSGNIYWQVYGTCMSFNPRDVLARAGVSGTGAIDPHLSNGWEDIPFLAELDLGPRDTITWESEESTIVSLDWAWDEGQGGGPDGAGVTVNWYLEALTETDEPRAEGEWGPNGLLQWWGTPDAAGPSSFAASQTFLGSTGGGASGWAALEGWGPGITSDEGPIFRFTALPSYIFSDTPPFTAMGMEVDVTQKKLYQYVAIRATVRPSRFRINRDPGIPDITWSGNGALDLNNTCGGRVLY